MNGSGMTAFLVTTESFTALALLLQIAALITLPNAEAGASFAPRFRECHWLRIPSGFRYEA